MGAMRDVSKRGSSQAPAMIGQGCLHGAAVPAKEQGDWVNTLFIGGFECG
jgi:hypothetical protein